MIPLNALGVSIGIAPRIDCVPGSQPQLCPRVDTIVAAGAKALLCKHASWSLAREVAYDR